MNPRKALARTRRDDPLASRLRDVQRLILVKGGDFDIYERETIRYWLRKGWSPERIVSELLADGK